MVDVSLEEAKRVVIGRAVLRSSDSMEDVYRKREMGKYLIDRELMDFLLTYGILMLHLTTGKCPC